MQVKKKKKKKGARRKFLISPGRSMGLGRFEEGSNRVEKKFSRSETKIIVSFCGDQIKRGVKARDCLVWGLE